MSSPPLCPLSGQRGGSSGTDPPPTSASPLLPNLRADFLLGSSSWPSGSIPFKDFAWISRLDLLQVRFGTLGLEKDGGATLTCNAAFGVTDLESAEFEIYTDAIFSIA